MGYSPRIDENDLVERARCRDQGAYGQLVERYWTKVFRVGLALTSSTADAEDVAQRTVFKAWQSIDSFHQGAYFGPWLMTIARNEARNCNRAAGARAGIWKQLVQDFQVSEVPSPEPSVLGAEQLREVLAAVNRLSEEHQQVIACRFLMDLSIEEIAAVLNLSKGTVKSRTHRGMDALRALDELRQWSESADD